MSALWALKSTPAELNSGIWLSVMNWYCTQSLAGRTRHPSIEFWVGDVDKWPRKRWPDWVVLGRNPGQRDPPAHQDPENVELQERIQGEKRWCPQTELLLMSQGGSFQVSLLLLFLN